MVVQLAVGDDVFIVDALRLRDLRPLAEALAGTTVVGHALQSDLKIFADRYGVLPKAAFDTQLAAAFCGFGLAISLADLIHTIVGVRLRKTQTVSDWSTRPLTEAQIEYLVDDVRHLFALADELRARLGQSGRLEWFEEDAKPLVDLQTYRTDPERLYLRIPGAMRMNRRELGVLRELAQLRDTLARERDIPLKYVIPDDVMAGIVALRPTKRDDLAQLRRIDGGTRKAYGDGIVEAVARGPHCRKISCRASRRGRPARNATRSSLAFRCSSTRSPARTSCRPHCSRRAPRSNASRASCRRRPRLWPTHWTRRPGARRSSPNRCTLCFPARSR